MVTRRETAKRVELFAPEELDVVMLHLRTNLFFDDVPEGTLVDVGVETDPLDAWSYYRRGLRSRPARKPSQKVPLHLLRLIQGLDRERPAYWTHAVFQLLDLSAAGRSDINRMIKETRARIRSDRRLHDITIGTDTPPHGLSIVLGGEGSSGLLERAHFLSHLNGLRRNADRWLGVAAEVSGDLITPVGVVVARPPFEQVVAEVLPPPSWVGGRRVVMKGTAGPTQTNE
jgi:hypothetical protein